jgi:hypothetical protein
MFSTSSLLQKKDFTSWMFLALFPLRVFTGTPFGNPPVKGSKKDLGDGEWKTIHFPPVCRQYGKADPVSHLCA